MGRIQLQPGALTAPVPPVIVSLGEGERANLITVGWTGILCTRPPMTYISLRPERHSYALLRETGEFAVNLTTERMARAADLCGMYTGRRRNKAQLSGLTLIPSSTVRCPSVKESPLTLECRVERVIPLGSHHVFLARIVDVTAEGDIIDPDGRLRLDRAGLMAYAHGEYFSLGRSLGKFGFSASRRKKGGKGGRGHGK